MNELARAIAKSGLLDSSALNEFRRWGVVTSEIEVPSRPASLVEVRRAITEALESEELVVTRVTDLEVVRYYLRTQKTGKLHLVLGEEGRSTEFEVSYGMTPIGEYILPWDAESLVPEMTNGETYLKCVNGKIYFSDVQEVYFGEQKAFMLCKPSEGAPHGEDDG